MKKITTVILFATFSFVSTLIAQKNNRLNVYGLLGFQENNYKSKFNSHSGTSVPLYFGSLDAIQNAPDCIGYLKNYS